LSIKAAARPVVGCENVQPAKFAGDIVIAWAR
jgi:hypothetical protein